MKLKQYLKLYIFSSFLLGSVQLYAQGGHLIVAVMAGPELNVAKTAQQIARQKYNLEVDLIPMLDYAAPNQALQGKIIDANAYQDQGFLAQQKRDANYRNLVVMGETFMYPMGAYSQKFHSIKEIPDNANIAIPNDPSNRGRALRLLQDYGFIHLRNPMDRTPSVDDIISNPRHLKIQQMAANLIVPSLNQVDVGIINNTYSALAGLYVFQNALFSEDKNLFYKNLIVAREDNQSDPDIQHFVEAFNSPEVFHKAQEAFKNAVVKCE